MRLILVAGLLVLAGCSTGPLSAANAPSTLACSGAEAIALLQAAGSSGETDAQKALAAATATGAVVVSPPCQQAIASASAAAPAAK